VRHDLAAGQRVPPGREGELGLSLIELMIATVLTVVGLVAIMHSCIRLHGLQRLDTEIEQAHRACRANLAELRTLSRTALPGFDGAGFDVPGPDGTTAILQPQPGDPDGMPGRIRVRVERATANRTLYRIDTEVAWIGVSGRHSIAFSTLWGGAP